MMDKNALITVFLTIGLVFNLSGCGEDIEDIPLSSGKREEVAVSLKSGEKNVSTGRKISVKIIPPNPNVKDELQAIVTGTQNATYRWERNDDEIEGLHASVLKGGFLKGDVMTVRVLSEDGEVMDSVEIANALPEITDVTITPEFIHNGTDISIKVGAQDPDGDSVLLAYKWFVNDTEILNETDATLEKNFFKRGDNVSFQVVPFDGKDFGETFISLSMIIPNGVPLFLSTPPSSFKSHIYEYRVRAEDPDGDNLTYRLSQAPEGMSIDAASGEIKWDITEDKEGEHTVEIVAEDDFGGEGFQKYALTVTANR